MLGTIKLASVALAAGASLTGTAPAMASTAPHQAPQPARVVCHLERESSPQLASPPRPEVHPHLRAGPAAGAARAGASQPVTR